MKQTYNQFHFYINLIIQVINIFELFLIGRYHLQTSNIYFDCIIFCSYSFEDSKYMSSRKITSSLCSSSQDYQNDQNSNRSNIKQSSTSKAFCKCRSGKLFQYSSSKAFESTDSQVPEYKQLKKEKRALSQYILTLQEGTIKALEEKQQQLEELQKSYQQFSFIKQSVQKEIQQYQQQILQLQRELDIISYELREEREIYNKQIQQKQSIVEYLTMQLSQLDEQIEEYSVRNIEMLQKIQEEEKKLMEFRLQLQAIENNLVLLSKNKIMNQKYKQPQIKTCLKKSCGKTRKNSEKILRNQLSQYIGNHRREISLIKLEYEQEIDQLKRYIEDSKIIVEQDSFIKEKCIEKSYFLQDSVSSLPINAQSKSYIIRSFEELESINGQKLNGPLIIQEYQNKLDENQQDTTTQTQEDKHLKTTRYVSKFIAGVLVGFVSFSIFSKFGKSL